MASKWYSFFTAATDSLVSTSRCKDPDNYYLMYQYPGAYYYKEGRENDKHSVEKMVPKFRTSRHYSWYMTQLKNLFPLNMSVTDTYKEMEAMMAVVWYQRQMAGRGKYTDWKQVIDYNQSPYPLDWIKIGKIRQSTIDKYLAILNQE